MPILEGLLPLRVHGGEFEAEAERLVAGGAAPRQARSIVARRLGFPHWTTLQAALAWRAKNSAERKAAWIGWVRDGTPRERALAAWALRDDPALLADDLVAACMGGETARVAEAIDRDPDWVRRPLPASTMQPLVAVTHSRLIGEPGFEERLLACAALLIRHGADVNACRTDPRWPDARLSALYGAAGVNHCAAMTKLLLDASADPNDGESLYHSVEAPDAGCTRLLLAAGARVCGSNALGRALDYDDLDRLRLLLASGGGARERPWIHGAILRGRSFAHVEALAAAGADLRAVDNAGVSLCRWAHRFGRMDVLALLERHDVVELLPQDEAFVAACTRGDETAARALRPAGSDPWARLAPALLETLPHCAAAGYTTAVRTMCVLGWPLETKAGWGATALNHAALFGHAEIMRILLASGADWRTEHDFGSTVLGTLSHASQAEDLARTGTGDFVGCARALFDAGVPEGAFERFVFSDAVEDLLAQAGV